MQPLLITHLSAVNSLGAGTAAIADALVERRSGLAPCTFETVALDTYAGEVKGLERLRFATGLAPYDCRNNRLAQAGLTQDGFADAVALARDKYGPARIGVFLGTSTSGVLETEIAFRHRDPTTGALPSDLSLRRDAQHVFGGGFRCALSALERARRRRLLRVLLHGEGVRQRGANDGRRRLRCGRGRRRR